MSCSCNKMLVNIKFYNSSKVVPKMCTTRTINFYQKVLNQYNQ
ncbi:hypothetical protein P10159_0070 [Citrobacter portucalensis]|nr:hypothetical protein P10159_0070 [Citrobacter portucalensis]